MGFGDKLKGLRDQAQQTVADNKDRIQGAVQVAGEAANTKTKGKYANKIANIGERVSGSVDKFAEGANPIAGDAPVDDSSAAPIVDEPANPIKASVADEAHFGMPTGTTEFPSQSAGFSESEVSSEESQPDGRSEPSSSPPDFE